MRVKLVIGGSIAVKVAVSVLLTLMFRASAVCLAYLPIPIDPSCCACGIKQFKLSLANVSRSIQTVM
jgi:hypothetical protein